MHWNNENRGTLIVTSGSRGIGAAISRLAAAQGYSVAVNYLKNDKAAAALIDEIKRSGGRCTLIRADVARETDVQHLFAEAERQLGPLTGLVNNAGITGDFARVDAIKTEMLQRLLAVNVIGTILCSREAVRRLSIKHGGRGGAIVNISSRAADLGSPGEWVHYAASKGAVNTFTVGLAREVASEGVRVNAVAPGLVETDIHAAAGDPGRVAKLANTIPLGRSATPQEIAEAVIWMLSSAASYVTGSILTVSGGR